MPRPPLSVRRLLQKQGTWEENPNPPPGYSEFRRYGDEPDGSPLPMPGSFPVVFQAFPTTEFTICRDVFTPLFDCVEKHCRSERMQGMFQQAEISEYEFINQMFSASLLGLAIHIARFSICQGYGHQLGDIATLKDIPLPPPVAMKISEIGNFCGTDERSWILADPIATVRKLIREANLAFNESFDLDDKRLPWLPVKPDDRDSNYHLASRLYNWLKERRIFVTEMELRDSVLGGTVPPPLIPLLQDLPPAERKAILLAFQRFDTGSHVYAGFNTEAGLKLLDMLQLPAPTSHEQCEFLTQQTAMARAINISARWEIASTTYVRWLRQSLCVGRSPPGRGGMIYGASVVNKVSHDIVEVKSFYPLSNAQKALAAVTGPWMEFGSLPMRYTTIGNIHVDQLKLAIATDCFSRQ